MPVESFRYEAQRAPQESLLIEQEQFRASPRFEAIVRFVEERGLAGTRDLGFFLQERLRGTVEPEGVTYVDIRKSEMGARSCVALQSEGISTKYLEEKYGSWLLKAGLSVHEKSDQRLCLELAAGVDKNTQFIPGDGPMNSSQILVLIEHFRARLDVAISTDTNPNNKNIFRAVSATFGVIAEELRFALRGEKLPAYIYQTALTAPLRAIGLILEQGK